MDYKEMINLLPVSVYGFESRPNLGHQTGRITYCNRTFSQFIGFTESELVSMSYDFYRNVLHPDDFHKVSKSMTTLISLGIDENTEYYQVKPKHSHKYEILKSIMRVVNPMPAEGSIQLVVTTLPATPDEIMKYYLTIEMADDLFDSLSVREKDIAILITKGLIDKEIADSLCISALTVKTHRANIRRKLQVKNTAEMATYLAPRLQHYSVAS